MRKVIEKAKLDLHQNISPGQTLLDAVIKPTRLYVRPILALIEQLGEPVKACRTSPEAELSKIFPGSFPTISPPCSIAISGPSFPFSN